ncbi:unnamed protein product [Brassicogethes aeneus]|uniref:Tubulin-specific chaperone D n=1 Tax=Brassicogethes aeneus TaxID=1431903 RepID=A0A9P0FJ62_BRAAE|nr:unnamed protein product [Brassicogethes aeneus]
MLVDRFVKQFIKKMSANQQPEEIEKDEVPFGLGCALEYFSESEEVFKMIDNIVEISDSDLVVKERAYEKFSAILGKYIEQPHLIDLNLDPLLEKLISIIRDNKNDMNVKHLTFKYMFVIVNVRGYKVIIRHLPHEVADFEAVLHLLEQQDPNDPETWTTRYILLLWLSIIVMIPFHMSRFDGFTEQEKESETTVMTRVLNIIKQYAVVSDKCRDAAAFLSYRFITRSDVKEIHLSSFFDWAIELSSAKHCPVFVRYGTLACVATILKHGKREDLLPYARKLLEWIVNAEFKNNSGSSVQKLMYKIIQRIGLTFVPPRIAAWRYKRGNRSLAANLSSGDASTDTSLDTNSLKEEIEENIDVPDEVEEVIDQLLQGLRSADGVIRWSAAKGIGRVTGRLPKELGDEVVGSVLELFSPREGDGAWHGGCISLAELGRRGLLLPERLPQVVPLVLKALVYDEPRGYSSVGSHIRDAACYVCWAFARAYESDVLAPYVNDIAGTLLVVTCFDKEINCRRAASAAFQENVGRQGTFPHGIDILTTADFFSVSVRNNAYLNISVFIAQFEEYTYPMIDHLVARKVDHWDCPIRELTAKALHNLTPMAPKYMVDNVLPALFTKTTSIDLNARHGAVLAIGEILHSLSKVHKNESMNTILTEKLIKSTKNLIPSFYEKFYFRGLGGELMKQACSDFIEKCSLASLPFHNDAIIEQWLSLLNDCILYKVVNIRTNAISALPVLLREYYVSDDKQPRHAEIIKFYVTHLESTNEEVNRMGTALALGVLPKFMLLSNLDFVVKSLIKSTEINQTTLKWAESRRDAVKALTAICATMAEDIGKDFSDDRILKIYDTFFEGLKDYTKDKRGDTGAWMREASMTGIQVLTILLAKHRKTLLTESLSTKIIAEVTQQAVEKIDRTRALAGRVFYSFLHIEPAIENISFLNELLTIFPKEECDALNWNSAAATFPKFVQLLQFPPYSYSIMIGLICSVGGLTETLVKNSSHALFAYLKEQQELKGLNEVKRLCEIIYKIFQDNQKVDRITVPMFSFLDKLFDSGCISFVSKEEDNNYAKRLLKLIQLEIAGCRDIYKLIDGINVLCQFIQVKGEVGNTALVQLSILLCHRQSYVRRSTSTKLYESLLVNGESSNINPDNLDDVMQVLSSTNWEEPVEQVKPIRNKLCNLMDISVPVSKKKV